MANRKWMNKNKFRSMHAEFTRHRAQNNMNNTHSKRERHERQRKSISFDHNQNKVRFVNVPPRSENKQYWFSESARIARKGFSFELEPSIAVELSVDCPVQLTTMALCREQQQLNTPLRQSKELSSSSPQQQQSVRSNTQEVAKNTNSSKRQARLSSSHVTSPTLNTFNEFNSLERNKYDRCFVEIREAFPLFTGLESMFDDSPDEEEDSFTSNGVNPVDRINHFSNEDNNRWFCLGSVLPNEMQKINVTLPSGVYHVRVSGKYSVQLFAQAWEVERALS